MNEEIKFVTREETFNDLAVRELAVGRSACICKLQFGRCKRSECGSCSIGEQYRNCYDQMNDYDKQRLAACVSRQYVIDSRSPEAWMPYKRYKRYMLSWYFGIIFGILLLLGLFAWFTGDPLAEPKRYAVPEALNQQIVDTIREAQYRIHDVNDDGLINCIDYTLMFKIVWDENYPDQYKMCQIVRNFGPRLHHLFIHIVTPELIIDVEPWATDPERYNMSFNWSDVFDPRYNIYGETNKWLREIRRR